jgi:hypothetical protein
MSLLETQSAKMPSAFLIPFCLLTVPLFLLLLLYNAADAIKDNGNT